MSLRSSFTKLVGSLSSRSTLLPAWAAASGLAAITAASAIGSGGCNNDSSLQCNSNGQDCMICNSYGCQPANQVGGSGGAGGGSSTTATTGGTGGTASTTSTATGAGGGTIGDQSCDATKPCPDNQMCVANYCRYACTDLTQCKLYDNRFTACVDGYCVEQ